LAAKIRDENVKLSLEYYPRIIFVARRGTCTENVKLSLEYYPKIIFVVRRGTCTPANQLQKHEDIFL
jgi:hypothetical protein